MLSTLCTRAATRIYCAPEGDRLLGGSSSKWKLATTRAHQVGGLRHRPDVDRIVELCKGLIGARADVWIGCQFPFGIGDVVGVAPRTCHGVAELAGPELEEVEDHERIGVVSPTRKRATAA